MQAGGVVGDGRSGGEVSAGDQLMFFRPFHLLELCCITEVLFATLSFCCRSRCC